MNTNKVKRDIIENFILWFTSDDEQKDKMISQIDSYIEEDHVNLIGSFFLNEINAELIEEEAYLDNEHPYHVYSAVTGDPRRPRIYCQSSFDGHIRTFMLTKNQDTIAKEHRDEILKYRLAKVTDEDEVYLSDIFMSMKCVKEITLS